MSRKTSPKTALKALEKIQEAARQAPDIPSLTALVASAAGAKKALGFAQCRRALFEKYYGLSLSGTDEARQSYVDRLQGIIADIDKIGERFLSVYYRFTYEFEQVADLFCQSRKIGRFIVERSIHRGIITFRWKDTSTGIWSFVELNPREERVTGFSVVQGNTCFDIDTAYLTKTVLSDLGGHPSMKAMWAGLCPRSPFEVGKLQYYQIKPTRETCIAWRYDYAGVCDRGIVGNPEVTSPLSLDERTEVLGFPVVHWIDFEAEFGKILELSCFNELQEKLKKREQGRIYRRARKIRLEQAQEASSTEVAASDTAA